MTELMVIFAVVLAAGGGFLFWQTSKQARALAALEQRLQTLQQHLEDEVRMASRGAFGVGKRLIEAEKRLTELHERFEQVENLQAAEGNSRQGRRILQKAVLEEEPTRNEAKLAAMLKGEAEEEFP